MYVLPRIECEAGFQPVGNRQDAGITFRCPTKKMILRRRNPDKGAEAFYIDNANPAQADIEWALQNPTPREGGCLVGDVMLMMNCGLRDTPPSIILRFYLGVPNRIAVICEYLLADWVKVGRGRSDLFLLCPNSGADEWWWKLPHHAFLPIEESIKVAGEFVLLEEKLACSNSASDVVDAWLDGSWLRLGEENRFMLEEDVFF